MPPIDIDRGSGTEQREGPDLWRLPEIVDLRIRWRRFDPPKLVTLAGRDDYWPEALEFEVHVSEPFVGRALYPVLWVGSERLTVAAAAADRVISFYARDHDRLVSDAAIALAWSSERSPGTPSKYRYTLPPKRE